MFLLHFLHIFTEMDDRLYLGRLIIFVACLSMLVGSLGAMRQTNIKRIIAYSGISNTGYVMSVIAISILLPNTYEISLSVLTYFFIIYISLTICLLFCITLLQKNITYKNDLTFFEGIYRSNPLISLVLSITVFSLAGIPPFAGFLMKYNVIYLIIRSAHFIGFYMYIAALVAIVSSVISAYFYLRIIKTIYFMNPKESIEQVSIKYSGSILIFMVILIVINLSAILLPIPSVKW